MDRPELVTIFGGSGFVGTQVVQVLARAGYRVRVAVRRPDLAGHVRPLGNVGQVVPVQANVRNMDSVHAAVRGAINFVSPDQTRAAVFVFQLKDGEAIPVRPQGLDPAKHYTVREMNPAPGRSALTQEGKSFTGEELMRDGVKPNCDKALEACVIELAP